MAYRFVDFLVVAGQSLWQVLPLGPTGYGDSPYQCFSAFAGNPLLISIDDIIEQGLLTVEEARSALGNLPTDHVDYGALIPAKYALLWRSFERFQSGCNSRLQKDYYQFCEDNSEWLTDYAMFMAIKESQGGGRGTELEFVIMVIAVSCVKLLSAHNSTQHTSRKHKV
jgi:4-alpha-glucanotransferase